MKLTAAVNQLNGRINEILQEEEYSNFMLERVYRMREDLVAPIVRTLKARPHLAGSADRVSALYRAVEEYVVFFQQKPGMREPRRKLIEGLKRRLRRELLRDEDREGELERLLDDIRRWQWKTTLDEQGRLVYATGSGAVVPARGAIAEEVGPKVIEQAVKAEKPYSEKIRPRDVRGDPGGLLKIEEGIRAIVVGDLHGRYDNLEHILRDKHNLRDILAGDAHLVFTGDAIHPPSSAMTSLDAYEDSFCVMLLIMTLKAENPFNVHYLIGNHDNAHVGGLPAGRGQVRQDRLFEKFVVEKFGESVFEHYRRFVKGSPAAAKVKTGEDHVILVHAGLTPRILHERGLINIFMKGRQGAELQALLWGRNYDRAHLETCLANVGARFIISGHTAPTRERAARYGLTVLGEGVFAHVHELQVIMCAQKDIFGYLDLDMKRSLPENVSDLLAPDGRPGFRMLRPKLAGNGDKG